MALPDEYYLKDYEYRRGNRYSVVYTVAKFNHRRFPEAVYEVKRGRFGWNCTCPASVNHGVECKHIQMILDWVAAGKPSPFEHLFKVDDLPARKPTQKIASVKSQKSA